MKKFNSLIILLLIIMIIEGPAQNYKPYTLSLGIFETIDASDIINISNLSTCCPKFMNGEGTSVYGGLYYSIFNVFGEENLSVSFGASIDYYTAIIYYDENLAINVDGEPFNGKIRHSIDFASYSLSPEINFKYNFNSLFIKYRLAADLYLKNNYTQKEEIVYPTDRGVFEDTKTRVRNVVRSQTDKLTLPIINSLAFGADIAFRSGVVISPGLNLGYHSSLSKSFDWTYIFYGLSIDIRLLE